MVRPTSFDDVGIILKSSQQNRGGNIKLPCPKCSPERTHKNDPSLSVHVTKGMWNCHHCGWFGSLAVQTDRNYVRPKQIVVDLDAIKKQNMAIWFQSRGISEETILHHKISVTTEYMAKFSEEIPVIAFPYFLDGEVINYKFRGKEKSFKMVKDAELIWYGLDDIQEGEEVVIFVEGEMDKLALFESGIKHCLSVPNGAPKEKGQAKRLEFFTSGKHIIDHAKKIIIATDNDQPGDILANELARMSNYDRCWRVFWPDDCKDANDVLVKHGKETLISCIDSAEPWPIEGIINPINVFKQVWSMKTSPIFETIYPGWDNLAKYYKPVAGHMTVFSGTPGSGKSVFLNAMFINMAQGSGWRFGVYSPEYFPVEFHVRDLMTAFAGVSFHDMDYKTAMQANAWVADHFRIISPNISEENEDVVPDLDYILDKAGELVETFQINGFVIDPWTEVEAYRPENSSQTDYIGRALTKIRQFGRKRGVHMWVSAHPSKPSPGSDGTKHIIKPYDLAGSAHWFNKPDNIMSIWRDKDNRDAPVELHIQKLRFNEDGNGDLGMVSFLFDRYTKRYTEQG